MGRFMLASLVLLVSASAVAAQETVRQVADVVTHNHQAEATFQAGCPIQNLVAFVKCPKEIGDPCVEDAHVFAVVAQPVDLALGTVTVSVRDLAYWRSGGNHLKATIKYTCAAAE